MLRFLQRIVSTFKCSSIGKKPSCLGIEPVFNSLRLEPGPPGNFCRFGCACFCSPESKSSYRQNRFDKRALFYSNLGARYFCRGLKVAWLCKQGGAFRAAKSRAAFSGATLCSGGGVARLWPQFVPLHAPRILAARGLPRYLQSYERLLIHIGGLVHN